MPLRVRLNVLSATLSILLCTAATAALTPTSLTLTDSSGSLAFSGGPYLVANPSSQATGIPTCNAALPCDELTLTVSMARGSAFGRMTAVAPVCQKPNGNAHPPM